MPCPVCKHEFQIPESGVAYLPVTTTAVLGRNRYCEKHEGERMEMYCLDCNMNVCAICCLEAHKTHKYKRIETVIELLEKALEQFSRSIDEKIKPLTSHIECLRDIAVQLAVENDKSLNNIKATELEVKRWSQRIKQLVDRQENDLLRELQSLKSAAETEVKSQRDALQLAVTEMEGFVTNLSELRSKGSLSDMKEATSTVDEKVKELLETWPIPCEYWAPSYKFTPRNIYELLRDNQNLIGHVVEVSDSGNVKSYYQDFSAADYICYSRSSSIILS